MKNTHLPTMTSLRVYISSSLLICIFLLSGCMGSDNDADNSKEMINKAQGRADKITQQRNLESERTKILTKLGDSLEAAKVKFDDRMIGFSRFEWQKINGRIQEVRKYTSHLYLSDKPEVNENIESFAKRLITKYIDKLNKKLLVASDHLKKLSNASNVNDIKNYVEKLKASIAPETLNSVRPDSRLEEYVKSMPELEKKIRPPMQKKLKNARDYLSEYEIIQTEIEKQLGQAH